MVECAIFRHDQFRIYSVPEKLKKYTRINTVHVFQCYRAGPSVFHIDFFESSTDLPPIFIAWEKFLCAIVQYSYAYYNPYMIIY
jgi:hypothetical protein